MHLQDAYFAEKEKTGNGTEIGFKEPASNVFTYTVTGGGDEDAVFTGTNDKGTLGDCGDSKSWTVTSSAGGEGGGAKHVAASPTEDACKALTPSFDDIGKGTQGS
ncbi:hypothetical protein [uncultured Fibrobacter sp.]|uniref:hypothetical protein n=1 Tax=uncultured Fibrobacter sp. TaxID=261512 RepID=UPI002612A3CE|nr:hypothetical protein [uncultured Fibrobacter sp.]